MKTSSIPQAMTVPSSSLTDTMKCGILKCNTMREGSIQRLLISSGWKQTTLMAFAFLQKRFNFHMDIRSCLMCFLYNEILFWLKRLQLYQMSFNSSRLYQLEWDRTRTNLFLLLKGLNTKPENIPLVLLLMKSATGVTENDFFTKLTFPIITQGSKVRKNNFFKKETSHLLWSSNTLQQALVPHKQSHFFL